MKIFTTVLALSIMAFAPLTVVDAAYADTKGCPPGLAKKNPPCVPPGQAKKGMTTSHGNGGDHDTGGDTDNDGDNDGDQVGKVIGRDDLVYLDDYNRYSLPALRNGQRYAVYDDQIVVIDAETYTILQLIRAFQALEN